MKVRITETVPDTFKKGECNNCPFAYITEHTIDETEVYYFTTHCILHKSYSNCPIEIVKEK